MLLCEPALREKARLARSFSYVSGLSAAEALVSCGQCALAPPFANGLDELPREGFVDAPFAQLMTDLERAVSARHPLVYETLCETLVGEKIFGLERVQRLADQPLGKTPRGELAAELGARVLAAGQ